MTPQEANALLTAASRMDNFITGTDQEFEVWAYALGGVDYQLAASVLT